ncbi:MAG: nuclear transport factor 2 family protein [Daejeonella sp.]|uniref:nuclear transport factor 2 family protein n=1 Tax=unclassified Daejeonella TaxID=2805396 RepID=UPI0023EE15D5|nr:nuclear transport factor 2 family protein [Daejeonella sp. JGW-45]
MNLKEKIEDLNQMILTGKQMDAFEKYYHEDVVMQENNQSPTVGKSANRERENQSVQMVEAFHGAEIKAVAVGPDVTMVEWMFDMTYKGGHRAKMEQVAVQKWKDGQIIHERFYYNSPK